MTREEALKRIEELEKIRNEMCPNAISVLELYQDLADYHGLSLEEVTERLKTVGGVGQVRPIREKNKTKSCEHCKYFVEIPQILSLGEPQGYFRFCGMGGLHEPIDDSWKLDHEICFVKKENNQ